MKRQLFWIICILVVASLISCKNKEKEFNILSKESENWIQLINDNNLSNWQVKIKGYPLGENFGNTFRIDDGILSVDYSAYSNFENRFGHLFYNVPFSKYKLKLKYRFIGSQAPGGESWATKNSGVMIHSQSPESMLLEQDFPVSIEVQLLGGLLTDEERPTANMCSPGTHVEMNGELITEHCLNSDSETFYDDQWIDLELLVLTDSLIVHRVNGKEVMRYSKPIIGGEYNVIKRSEGNKLASGYIALQSESHPIEFKNIEILNLEEN